MKSWIKLISVGVLAMALAVIMDTPVGAQDNDPCRTTRVLGFMTTEPALAGRHIPGFDVTVIWAVNNASQVSFRETDGDWQTVPEMGYRTVRPLYDTTYWLRATNSEGWEFETPLFVDIQERPHLLSFEATPREIRAGESVELTWEAIHSEYVVIDSRPGGEQYWEPDYDALEHRALQGSLTVSPTQTTTYYLFAVGTLDDGRPSSAGWQQTVQVSDEPVAEDQ